MYICLSTSTITKDNELNNNHRIICIDDPFHEEIDKWNLESNDYEFEFTKDFNEIHTVN